MKRHEIFIECEADLRISIVNPQDINEDYLLALNDNNQAMYMNLEYAQYNKSLLSKYIDEQLLSNNYLFGLYKSDYLIATSRIHDVTTYNAWQGVLVFKKYQKQGFGSLLVKTVSDYVLEKLHINTVSAGIYMRNIASLALFRKAGFTYKFDDLNHLGRQVWIKAHV